MTKSTFGEDEPLKTEFSPEFAAGLSSEAVQVVYDSCRRSWTSWARWRHRTVVSGGAEIWIADRIALRGGAIAEKDDGDWAMSYTGGIGLKTRQGEIGYSLMGKKGGVSAQSVTVSAWF